MLGANKESLGMERAGHHHLCWAVDRLLRRGRGDLARALLQRWLAAAPDADALCLLGRLQLSEDDLAGAVRAFGLAVWADDCHPPAHLGLARCYLLSGRIEAAIDHLRVAVRLDAEAPQPKILLGALLRRCGRRREALMHLLAVPAAPRLKSALRAELRACLGMKPAALLPAC